jgi:transcriptional regulator with XRE-family HTH domain
MLSGLKLIREIRGLSQLELGRRAGIPNSKISMVECGHKDLTPDMAVKLSEVLGVQIDPTYRLRQV